MVEQIVRDDVTWYECETCGLLLETEQEATEHERHCDGEDEASYIQ